MQSAGDPSLLRRLAVSFGKGVAFSVAIKLTENAVTPRSAGALPAAAPSQEKLRTTVPSPSPSQAQIDQKIIQAIVTTVEKRLNEHASQVQQQIAGLETTVTANVQAATARRIEQEMSALRAQVVTIQREFAQAVAGIVAEHAAVQVAERTRGMEAAMQANIHAAVAPLLEQIRELRKRIAETDGERDTAIHEPAPARPVEVARSGGDADSLASTGGQFSPRLSASVRRLPR